MSGKYTFGKEESFMIQWENLSTLSSFEELNKVERVNLVEVMSGEEGATRAKNYRSEMAEGLSFNYAAKEVND